MSTKLDTDDDEEDFFAMIRGGPDPGEVVPEIQCDSEHSEEFETVLEEFYGRYNIDNVSKVPHLASKFNERRWELWEQLSIKYRLSVGESCRFWTLFNLSAPCRAKTTKRLFGTDTEPKIYMDNERDAFWLSIVGLADQSADDKNAYSKYLSELVSEAPIDSDAVELDVVRTHQELPLFQQESVRQSLSNILRVYCQLNGVQYVQGMNEVLAVVFFVMRDEGTTFWAFSAIMAQMKDLFTVEADSTSDGIYSRIDYVWSLLRRHNYGLCKHLRKIDFPLPTLGMRWMTTLLAIDVTLPDVVQVWDTALLSLSSNNLVIFTACLVTAYINEMADILLPNDDVVEAASMFGKGHELDIRSLIDSAMSIYAFEKFLVGKYEPASDEPLIDIVADAVDSAKARLVNAIDPIHKAKLEKAGNAIGAWFGQMMPDMHSEIPE